MGGGTRAGMTPALDTPTECPEKKLTELGGDRNKHRRNKVGIYLTSKAHNSFQNLPHPLLSMSLDCFVCSE